MVTDHVDPSRGVRAPGDYGPGDQRPLFLPRYAYHYRPKSRAFLFVLVRPPAEFWTTTGTGRRC